MSIPKMTIKIIIQSGKYFIDAIKKASEETINFFLINLEDMYINWWIEYDYSIANQNLVHRCLREAHATYNADRPHKYPSIETISLYWRLRKILRRYKLL